MAAVCVAGLLELKLMGQGGMYHYNSSQVTPVNFTLFHVHVIKFRIDMKKYDVKIRSNEDRNGFLGPVFEK